QDQSCLRIQCRGLPLILLGHSTFASSLTAFLNKFGEAEIQNFYQTVFAHHYIFRLDVTMDYICVMGRHESGCDLNSNVDRLANGKSPASKILTQSLAMHEFGSYESSIVGRADLIYR